MMQLFTRFIFAAVLACGLMAGTASAQITAGKDYRLINPPQPTESGKKIEVIEFFWYGCPHCYHLEPSLNAWLKRKPADVEFRLVPAIFQDSWAPLARTYYALEAMGLVGKLHESVFTAIHEQKIFLQDPKILFDWVAKQGVDRKKFIDAYNSFSVQSRVKRSVDMTKSYDIPGTPALTVDGKYLTGPSMILKPDNTIDYDRYFKVLDQVIALARKTHNAK